ncbi:Holliday junction resolvase RuvX [Georgenia satyanarayanai]|uniref:Holliday junction resolvase RuvX n=1 Tax=Georgenia satyanarayanai TaxID=860221 RepID=UPI0012640561|nr:Holliday junction resolvase RuvX [Georgenia satyanarayanai]
MSDQASAFVRGTRIGVDVGAVRVGLARSDADGLLATPVETVTGDRPVQLRRVADIVRELEAVAVVVGLPRQLSGGEGHAAALAREYAGELARVCDPVPVRLVDERLTTVSAHQALHRSGRPGRRHRAVVDQVAAVMILQAALDQERRTGQPAGELVDHGMEAEA